MDHPFRSAAVGGFNKQDVLTFLEEQSKQAAQAQQQLSDQLEEVNQHNENLHQEGDDLRRQLEELQRELEDLRQGAASSPYETAGAEALPGLEQLVDQILRRLRV